jgi:outer membrane immunogenic protein
MNAMKSIWLTSVALPALFAGQALAQTPPAAIVNWTGFYVGLNAGGAWERSGASTGLPCTETSATYYLCAVNLPATYANAAALSAAGTGRLSASGPSLGGQAGYNWQIGQFVSGVEVDAESFHLRASRQASGSFGPNQTADLIGIPVNYTISSSVGTDWLATVRGRIGWAFDRFLVYGTGGLALTDLQASNAYSDSDTGVGNWHGRGTRAGWTAGAGLEFALNRNWSVKAEYLYLNFGSIVTSGQIKAYGYTQGINTSTDLTAHLARAGVNYKF